MKGSLIYNEKEKQVVISATTECFWACSIVDGNLRLNDYYGTLSTNTLSASTLVGTYGKNEMYGTIMCRFDNGQCMFFKTCEIMPSPINMFNVINTKYFLFGKGTKTYIYLYYGTVGYQEEILPNIIVTRQGQYTVETDIITYDGSYTDYQFDNYKMTMQEYEKNNAYVLICFESLNDTLFNETIVFSLEKSNSVFSNYQIVVTLSQDLTPNKPSLFKVSPSVIFLTSKSLQQRISVLHLKDGVTQPYYVFGPRNQTHSNMGAQIVTEYLSIEESSQTQEQGFDNIDFGEVDKNATHFIFKMDDTASNQTTEDSPHILTVVSDNIKEPQYAVEVEVFFQYIYDPSNFIKFKQIKGIYGYTTDNNIFSSETSYTFSENVNVNEINIHWVKNEPNTAVTLPNTFYVSYDGGNNAQITIESVPSYFNIYQQSESIKEVINGDTLTLSLETEVNNNEQIILQNQNGGKCYINVSSDDDIFNYENTEFGFYYNGKIQSIREIEIAANTSVYEPIQIISFNDSEEIVFVDTLFTNITDNTVVCNVVKNIASEKTDSVTLTYTKEIVQYSFIKKFNQNIGKYYITYGSLHAKQIDGEIIYELHDTNDYYFEDNSITLPQPIKDKELPWRITHNGNGVKFDIYRYDNANWHIISNNETTSSGGTIVTNTNGIGTDNKDGKRYIYVGFVEKPHFTNLYIETIEYTVRDGDICLIAKQKPLQDTTESIILKQDLSFKEITLYAKVLGSLSANSIFKIGNKSALSEMKSVIGEDTSISINVPSNTTNKLYYASYDIIDAFHNKNVDVDIKLSQTYNLISENLSKWDHTIADLYYTNNEQLDKPYEHWDEILSKELTYEETVENIINESEMDNLFTNKPKQSSYWELDVVNGVLNFKYRYSLADGFAKNILPIRVKELKDGSKIAYLFCAKVGDKGVWYFLVDNKKGIIHKYTIDALYDSAVDYYETNEGQLIYYTQYAHKYPIIPYYVKVNNTELSSFTNFFTHQNKKYEIYSNNDDHNVMFVEQSTFEVLWEKPYFKLIDSLLNGKENILNGLSYEHNQQIYPIDVVCVSREDAYLNILDSADGSTNSDKDKYIVLNGIKYNSDINIEKIVLDNNQTIPTFNSGTIVNLKDISIPCVVNDATEYVIIDYVTYPLINGKLMYNGTTYNKEGDNDIFIIENRGYSAYTLNGEIYTIINNQRCTFDTANTASTISYYFYNTFEDSERCEVKNVVNETFKFDINLSDLLNNKLIQGTYNDYLLTNGYISINNNYYGVQKENYFDLLSTNYDIITKEYINIPWSAITSNEEYSASTHTIKFNDNSEIIIINEDNMATKYINSGDTYTISGDNVEIIFQDYSQIIFNEDCVITFLNDVNVDVINNDNILTQEYKTHFSRFCARKSIMNFPPQTRILIHSNASYCKMYVTENVVVVDDTYHKVVQVNGQNAIIYNNNIYYIYNNVCLINGSIYQSHEKCLLYEKNDNISLIKVSAFTNSNTAYSSETFNNVVYGYISDNTIQIVKATSTDIKYKITLPTYNSTESATTHISLCEYVMSDLFILNKDKYTYQRGRINAYTYDLNVNSPLNKQIDLIIENRQLEIVIDKYAVTINNKTYITDKSVNYLFEHSGITQSVWDWCENKMLPSIPIATSVTTINLPIQASITFYNIEVPCVENGYVLIDDKYYPLLEMTQQQLKIGASDTLVPLQCYDVDNRTMVNQNYQIIKNEDKVYYKFKDIPYNTIGKITSEGTSYHTFYTRQSFYMLTYNEPFPNDLSIEQVPNTAKIVYQPFINTNGYDIEANLSTIWGLGTMNSEYYLCPFKHNLNDTNLSPFEINCFQNEQYAEIFYWKQHEQNNDVIHQVNMNPSSSLIVSGISYRYNDKTYYTNLTFSMNIDSYQINEQDYNELKESIKMYEWNTLEEMLVDFKGTTGNSSWTGVTEFTKNFWSIATVPGLYHKTTDTTNLYNVICIGNKGDSAWNDGLDGSEYNQFPFTLTFDNVTAIFNKGEYIADDIHFTTDDEGKISSMWTMDDEKQIFVDDIKENAYDGIFCYYKVNYLITNNNGDEKEKVFSANEFASLSANCTYWILIQSWQYSENFHIPYIFVSSTITETVSSFTLLKEEKYCPKISFKQTDTPSIFYVTQPWGKTNLHAYLYMPTLYTEKTKFEVYSHQSRDLDYIEYNSMSNQISLNIENGKLVYTPPRLRTNSTESFIIYKDDFKYQLNKSYKKYEMNALTNRITIDDKYILVNVNETNPNSPIGEIELDPNASLTLDINYQHLPIAKNGVQTITIANESEIPQDVKIVIKQKNSDNQNKGIFNIHLD